ncbi:MAG: Ig-like domain-containing protein, partial [candidate division KSB1 bacterium]|nr:Ig-like domain-containing protein [candidate division KSB1 bacterium]
GNSRPSNQKRLFRIDTTPPTSAITFPRNGDQISTSSVTITGTATDGGIGVDSVQVSTDGGQTWKLATLTGANFSTWRYEWKEFRSGAYTLKSRAFDKLRHVETPSSGVSVVVALTGVSEPGREEIPASFALGQNYPNPFNPETIIEFALPERSRVHIRVFSLAGAEVCTLVDDVMAPGYHKIRWDGKDAAGRLVPTGVYFYKMFAGEFVAVRKSVVIH